MMKKNRILLILGAIALSCTSFSQTEGEVEVEAEVLDPQEIELYPVAVGCEHLDNEEAYQCLTRSFQMHVVDNFEFPSDAREAGLGGRVWVNFIIEKDGSVSTVEVVRSSGVASIDAEAVRVMKLLPDLAAPALVNGEPQRMSYTFPINAQMR